MELHILGSGVSLPQPDRASPGFLVRESDTTLLVDPSPGSLTRMARSGCGLDVLSAVAITHLHLDHSGELAALVFALNNPEAPSRGPLTVFGPVGLLERHARLNMTYGRWMRLPTSGLTLYEYRSGEPLAAGDLCITPIPVEHTPEAHGLRIRGASGRVLAVSGDTGPCPGLDRLLEGAHTALLNCSSPTPLDRHLHPEACGMAAARAGLQRVVLTHFYPDCQGVDMTAPLREYFEGEVIMAEDGMVIVV